MKVSLIIINLIKNLFINCFYIQLDSPAQALERIFGIESYINSKDRNDSGIDLFDKDLKFDFKQRFWKIKFDWDFYKRSYT